MSFESAETVDCVELTAVDTALRLEDISDDIATVSLWLECTLSVRVQLLSWRHQFFEIRSLNSTDSPQFSRVAHCAGGLHVSPILKEFPWCYELMSSVS
jgi:hypothetical protein